VVLDNTDYSPGQELTEDILAILHTFSCRLHGLRRYRNAIKEDPGLSDKGAAPDTPPVV
jgi:predicted site-specific integrase-resolvase